MFQKTIKLAIAILVSSSVVQARASSSCYIYVAGNCSAHPEVKTFQWFADDYNGSASVNGICLHRASEYRAYCQMPPDPGQYVNAAFLLNGQMTNAQQFRGGAIPVTTFGADWSPIVTNY